MLINVKKEISSKCFLKNSRAFTLAEVLITLGIIGIVASMTIPTLINTANDLKFKSAWKKSYSEISQVVTLIKSERGDLDYGGTYPTAPQGFYNDFISNISVVQSSTNAGAGGFFFHSVIASPNRKWYSLNGTECTTGPNTGYPSGILKSGALFYISGLSDFEILIDVNGYALPNTIGKDIFGVHAYTIGRVAPGGSFKSSEFLSTLNTSNCYDASVTVGQTCDSSHVGWGCSATKLME